MEKRLVFFKNEGKNTILKTNPPFCHGFAIQFSIRDSGLQRFVAKIHVDRFQSSLVNTLKQPLQICVVAPGLLYSKPPTKQQTHRREKQAV